MEKQNLNKDKFSIEQFCEDFLDSYYEYEDFLIEKENSTKLSECLFKLSKYTLQDIAESVGLKNFEKLQKSKLVLELEQKILQNFLEIFEFYKPIYYSTFEILLNSTQQNNNYENLNSLIQKMQSTYDEDIESILEETLKIGLNNGFIFLCETNETKNGNHDDDKISFFIPEEIVSKFLDCEKNKKNNLEPGKFSDFANYAKILSTLYGAYDFNLFLQIYNRDFPQQKIQNKTELKKLLEKVANINKILKIKNQFIINSQITSKALFDDLISSRKKFNPYIPSKTEIQEKYFCIDYDDDLEGFYEFIKFFHEINANILEINHIVFELLFYIKMFYPIKQIVEFLDEDYKIIFSEKQLKKFLSIYQNLAANAHLWVNFGHTPDSCRDEKGNLKKDVYTEEFFEEQKRAMNLQHPQIELPKDFVIPSENEIKEKQKI